MVETYLICFRGKAMVGVQAATIRTAWSCSKSGGERWPRAEPRRCELYQPSM